MSQSNMSGSHVSGTVARARGGVGPTRGITVMAAPGAAAVGRDAPGAPHPGPAVGAVMPLHPGPPPRAAGELGSPDSRLTE